LSVVSVTVAAALAGWPVTVGVVEVYMLLFSNLRVTSFGFPYVVSQTEKKLFSKQ